ncbi:HNH endonuclease [Pantoea agglomerans]|uniref:HNH endonuclease n=1 Tax=Enterobacter agglomerans TaxID=549 RepID=A0ACC5RNX9_ENTAG|nr:HNH endonuclease [Pantoea agglomerans]MBK4726354.1 HNH endonuclease [Pantoea agglomerans]
MNITEDQLLEVAWFLSKFGEKEPPKTLEITKWKEAFALFYPRFGAGKTSVKFHNSLKNSRDRFDSWISVSRRGWRNKDGTPAELSMAEQKVMTRMSLLSEQSVAQRILSLIADSTESSELHDVTLIENDKHLDETIRQRLIAARLGQGEFRKNCLKQYPACPVTHINFSPLLRASHIKPWSDCDNAQERLDPHNGLMLAAHIDALFDNGWISFSNEGDILISPELDEDVVKQFALSDKKIPAFPEAAHIYLEWHREKLLR